MNTRNFFLLTVAFSLLCIGVYLLINREIPQSPQEQLTVALDWLPNTNHTGLFVAIEKGWYAEAGLDVRVLPYADAVMADVLVHSGVADVGISSTEAVVADYAANAPVVSIAAIIARNTSSLVVRRDSGITRPRELDGKVYGGYGAPYEVPVVSTIIKTDGGEGVFTHITLGVDALEALRAKRIDAAWIFDGWQGIQAKREELHLTTFPISAFGIPEYSTPNIITSPETLAKKHAALKKFIAATARGYEYARIHPRESAELLIAAAPPGTFPDTEQVYESQEYLSPRYADPGERWGFQHESFWRDYTRFMLEHRAVRDMSGNDVTDISHSALYTNELLP